MALHVSARHCGHRATPVQPMARQVAAHRGKAGILGLASVLTAQVASCGMGQVKDVFLSG